MNCVNENQNNGMRCDITFEVPWPIVKARSNLTTGFSRGKLLKSQLRKNTRRSNVYVK